MKTSLISAAERVFFVFALLSTLGLAPRPVPAQTAPASTATQATPRPTLPTLPKPPLRPADWIVEHEPVTPNASPEARALLKFLYSISGKHTVIGQHNFAGVHTLSTAAAALRLGKIPALYGTDWGFSRAGDIDSIYARDMTVQEIIKQYRAGSIIAICWHEVRPTADEPVTFQGSPTSVQGHLSDADWDQLLTPGSEINKRWCAQVDVIAGYLKQLEAAHVPLLWRPVHEMNGNWFWWGGRLGDRGTKQLYRMMFDRLVNHHKLTNLIWVWNCDQPSQPDRQFVDYFPGQQYVDVLALDCYGTFQQRFYDEMNALSDGKVLAISEGGPPAPDVYKTQPKWAYYMPWATARFPVTDSRTTTASASVALARGGRGGRAITVSASAAPARGGRGGGFGGGGRGGFDWAEMARDPRMLGLEDPAYRQAIQPMRVASSLLPLSAAPTSSPTLTLMVR